MDQPEMETLIKNIDARTTRIEQILPTLATKEDLRGFATKEDLQACASKDDVREEGERTRLHFDVVAEAMKLAFADRAFWLGDPEYARVPRGLDTKAYAAQLASRIRMDRITHCGYDQDYTLAEYLEEFGAMVPGSRAGPRSQRAQTR